MKAETTTRKQSKETAPSEGLSHRQEGTNRTCILVLGMHRSGTSAITRVLSLLGASLPKNLLGAGPGNPTGHWEPERLVQLHDQMLRDAGSRWDDWRPFDPEKLGAERLEHYRSEIARIIAEEFDDAPLFVVKDPRICRFAPLYESILAQAGISARFVLPVRNPLAVIASLQARGGNATKGFAGLLWLRHVLDADAATRGKPRQFLSYERFLDDWRSAADAVARSLEISWPRAVEDAATDVEAHVSRDLQHHAPNLDALVQDERVAGWIKDTYAAILQLTVKEDADAHAELDRVRAEFEQGVRVFGDATHPSMAAYQAHVHDMESSIRTLSAAGVQKDETIGRLTQEIADTGTRLAVSTSERQQLQTRVQHLESEAVQRESVIGQFQTQVEQLHNEAAEREALHEQVRLRIQQLMTEADERETSLAQLRRDLKTAQSDRRKAVERAKLGLQNIHRLERDLAAEKGISERLLKAETRLEADLEDRTRRIAALANELAAYRASRLGRLQSVFQRIGETPWRVKLRAGKSLIVQPLNDLLPNRETGKPTSWEVTGNDPHFSLTWDVPRKLPVGHYTLSVVVGDGAALLADMHLYVDSGEGFNEAEVVRLTDFQIAHGKYSADFILPLGARRLRLDPTDRAGTFVADDFRLRKLSRAEYYARLSRRAYRQLRARDLPLTAIAAKGISALRKNGPRGLAGRLRDGVARVASGSTSYSAWVERFDTFGPVQARELEERIASLGSSPLISVVMPVYNTPEALLIETIESVRSQVYQNWELCIADDCSTLPHVRKVLERFVSLDKRIKVEFREKNGHISHATNSAFELVTGDWVALLDHDDLLRPHALGEVAIEIGDHPEAQLIYSDEDKVDVEGQRYDPYFKPDFSRELFRSQNYFNHLTIHRAANIRAVGGWRPGFEGSQDYDLNLRIVERIDAGLIRHIPKILYHWRAVAGSTAAAGSEKDYAYSAGFRALEEHVERTGIPAKVEPAPETPFYRLRFDVPTPEPFVSLIIPTRDKVEILRNCIRSITEKTNYDQYEIIIVDNGSCETETLTYFKELKKSKRFRIIRYDRPFNYSAINNYAVKRARGTVVGLINNDIEVISADWLREMVSWAVQPDIGCVGAKLYYGNDTIQHAGVVIGLGGVAGHSHKHFARAHPGYFFRLKVVQNLSAVTAACLLVRKEVFDKVAGLNETELRVAFNDVDFCLKVQGAGYLNVWTPYAELYHLESISRGAEDDPEKVRRFNGEIDYMVTTWETRTKPDPYYSPNLTRDREDFSLNTSM